MKYLDTFIIAAGVCAVLYLLATREPEPRPVNPVQKFQDDCAASGGRYVYTDTDGHLCLK